MRELLQRLETATLEELREEWRCQKFGEVPRLRSPDLLRRIIGWRIQSAAHGGLDRRTQRILAGRDGGREQRLRPGTVLVREWMGQRYEVHVTAGGYVWSGRTFDSLSAVARAITGTRWNGPRFFGLREAKP